MGHSKRWVVHEGVSGPGVCVGGGAVWAHQWCTVIKRKEKKKCRSGNSSEELSKSTAILENIHGSSARPGSTHSASVQHRYRTSDCSGFGKKLKSSTALQMGQPGVGSMVTAIRASFLPVGAHDAPLQ